MAGILTSARSRTNGSRVAREALAVLVVTSLTSSAAGVAAVARRSGTATMALSLGGAGLDSADSATRARVHAGLRKLPLYFIENHGQLDPRVAYYVHGAANSVYFTKTGIVFVLTSRAGEDSTARPASAAISPRARGAERPRIRRFAVSLDFEGANPAVRVVGRERTPAVVSYFRGRPSEWKTALATYASVAYEELWPGIDLVYGSESGQPKYSFLVKPGANPGRIRLVYRGASGVRLADGGRLAVEGPTGGFMEERPFAYQEAPRGARTEVATAFEPETGAQGGEYRIGFRVGAYDRATPLVLDPLVLTYCGYIGGSGDDTASAIAMDSSGNIYVAGATNSAQATFPETVGPDLTQNGGTDAFVAKVDASGSLVYCGYIGGSGALSADNGNGIAVDGSGNAYVVGQVDSTQAQGFPVLGGPDLTYNGGFSDAYVAKVNPSGTALVYCGYIGGSAADRGYAVVVDGTGNAYVVGDTASTEATFPVLTGPDGTFNGGSYDAFAAKVDASGTLVYAGYIGGSGTDDAYGVAVDGAGAAYVTGYTDSTQATFPVAGGPDTTANGSTDVFVTKVNAAGNALVYSGFIGGSGADGGRGIVVDGSGNAYVAGETASSEATFPVAGGPDLTYNGAIDGFVAKVNASGNALVYCGYVGGAQFDIAFDVAIDSALSAHVVGYTQSTEATFPVLVGPDLTQNGLTDAFVVKVSASGTAFVYGGFIGGSGDDYGRSIEIDGSRNVHVGGFTTSTQASFPVTAGPDLSFNGGTYDVFVAKLASTPTAVELVSFEAAGLDGGVGLTWTTASELDNLGFHLYRGASPDGPWERLDASLIPGLGSSPEGKSYSFLDSALANGTTYFYRLEDVDRHGGVTSHGPVSATPQPAGTPSPSPLPSPSPGPSPSPAPPRKAHGDPAQQSLRVLERTASCVTLELLTGGFYSQDQPDGTTKLLVPGFFDHAEPGRPVVPTRRAWIDAIVGRGVKLVAVQASDLVSFSGLKVPLAGRPVAVTAADGTYRAGYVPVSREEARRGGTGLFPAAFAFLHQTAFQAETKKVYLELAPLRFEPTGRLTLARRLLVRLSFTGHVAGERGRVGRGRRAPGSLAEAEVPGALIARFATRLPGLHGVAFDDIPGLDAALPTSSLRLGRLGRPVAFHVEPRARTFGPGSVLYFLGEGAGSAYANEAVYELSLGGDGVQMTAAPPRRVAPGSPASLRHEDVFESNAVYLPALTEAKDLWVWDLGIAGGGGTDYPFTPSAPAVGTDPAVLRVFLQGGSDTPADPDHHVLAFLNGSLVGEIRFDGMLPAALEAELPSSLLLPGQNTLRLENAGDTGSSASFVYLDRFAIEYPWDLSPITGVVDGTAPRAGGLDLPAARGSLLFDVSTTVPRFLGRASSSGRLRVSVEAGHRYLAASPGAVLAPDVRPVSPTSLRDPANRADWILIAPQALLAAAEPLLEHRQAQGLGAVAVPLEDVTSDFGFGEAGPHGVRSFLAYAFHRWAAPSPRYVLLLGDASYDPKGRLGGTSRPDLIPSPLVKSTFLWAPSDPVYAAVNGDDTLPDLAIGRINAASPAEAQAAVHKILDFENASLTLAGTATLVADDPDPAAGDFEASLDEIASLLPDRPVEKLFLSRLGGAATRTAVRAAFDTGRSLVSYVGHGSSGLWATEGVLRSPDVDAFAPQAVQPLVLTMTCSNGYFVSPNTNSLAERLVLADGKGAIGSFSPSGLSLNEPGHVFHRAIVTELHSSAHARLGDLILAAQAEYAASGAFPELLEIYNLFGDPGLRIQ